MKQKREMRSKRGKVDDKAKKVNICFVLYDPIKAQSEQNPAAVDVLIWARSGAAPPCGLLSDTRQVSLWPLPPSGGPTGCTL